MVSGDAAREVAQVRRKDDRHAQVRGDLRLVPVGENTVRLQAHFAEAGGHAGLAPGAADAAGGVDHRPLVEVQQLFSINGFSASCAAVG